MGIARGYASDGRDRAGPTESPIVRMSVDHGFESGIQFSAGWEG